MKITYSILALLFIAILWTWTQMPEISSERGMVTNLPWIIKTDDQGGSAVFGLKIGDSTARQAQQLFNDEAEFGMFIDTNGTKSLEAFFNHTFIAGLQARITLTLTATSSQMSAFAEQAIDKKPQPSNSYKLVLPSELNETLLGLSFSSITYQPKIKIEPEVLQSRFGKPSRIEQINAELHHWHYPEKGLLIVLIKDEKPVFHYVRPDQYELYFNPGNTGNSRTGKAEAKTASKLRVDTQESDVGKN